MNVGCSHSVSGADDDANVGYSQCISGEAEHARRATADAVDVPDNEAMAETKLGDQIVEIEAASAELTRRIDVAVAAVQATAAPAGADPTQWDAAALQVVDQLLVAAYNATVWAVPDAVARLCNLAAAAGEAPTATSPLVARALRLRTVAQELTREINLTLAELTEIPTAVRVDTSPVWDLLEAIDEGLWKRADSAAASLDDLAALVDKEVAR
jgi:hypothetical protein